MRKFYPVVWYTDVEADSPEDAARQAGADLRGRGKESISFQVGMPGESWLKLDGTFEWVDDPALKPCPHGVEDWRDCEPCCMSEQVVVVQGGTVITKEMLYNE